MLFYPYVQALVDSIEIKELKKTYREPEKKEKYFYAVYHVVAGILIFFLITEVILYVYFTISG